MSLPMDPVFGAPSAHGPLDLLVGVYAYAIQIYADFSGYTDIAIGCALLLGIRFPQNFDAPVPRAVDPGLLAAVAHDAVAVAARLPLHPAGWQPARRARSTYRNLFLTMVIGGLWHGAAMTFLVWGALHGGYLVGERWVKAAVGGDPCRARAPGADHRRPPVAAHLQPRVPGLDLLPRPSPSARPSRCSAASSPAPSPTSSSPACSSPTIALMLASQFVPPRAVERAQVQLHHPRPWPPGRLPGRRAHRHRRPRPRRRGPVHLLPVLMHPRRSPSASSSELAYGPPPADPLSARRAAEPPPRGWGAPAEPLPPTPPARTRCTAPPPDAGRGAPGSSRRGGCCSTMVLALALAGPGERRRAGASAPSASRSGPARDRSLAHLAPRAGHRRRRPGSPPAPPRRLGGGNEDRGGSGVPLGSGPAPPCPRTPATPLRAPSADEPLRIYIGGDSIIRDAGDAFLDPASDSPLSTRRSATRTPPGLTRPDFYDWSAALADDMDVHRPEVAFILFGGNESQGIRAPTARLRRPERPTAATGVRPPGGRVMDIPRANDRTVFGVVLPPMRDDGFKGRPDIMNDIYREAAESRPWMTYLDTATGLR